MLQTFTSGDFNIFLKDFGSRIGDLGTWPEHTAGRYANYSYSTSDLTCGNVGVCMSPGVVSGLPLCEF